MLLLDIIVPHYNEPLEVVKPFINMINSQKGIDFKDFRVILVHDGSEPFPEESLKGPAEILQICQRQNGVSSARNTGIDISDAEWVNFSDCDDCYSSIFSLYMLFNVLRKDKDHDLLWAPFYMINGNRLMKYDKYNPIFIHNKYYRRKFLNKEGIRFCEKLHMSEDSAFNMIVQTRLGEGKIAQIETSEPVYSWCRRKGSITMSPEKWLHNVEGHFDRNLYVLEECRKNPDLRPDLMCGRTITDAYATLTKPGIEGDPEPVMKRVAKFYLENKDTIDGLTKEQMDQLLLVSDTEFGNNEGNRRIRPSLDDWLIRLSAYE